MEKTFMGTFNLENLSNEFRIKIPSWQPIMVGGRLVDRFSFDPVDQGMIMEMPDDADLVAVQAVIDAHDPTQPTAVQVLRSKVITILQSAIGISVGALTTAQRNAVIVAMAYKLGAIDQNLVVQDPSQWL